MKMKIRNMVIGTLIVGSLFVGGKIMADSNSNYKNVRVEQSVSRLEPKIKISFNRNRKVTNIEGITPDGEVISFKNSKLIGYNANKVVNLLVKEVYRSGQYVDDVDRNRETMVIDMEVESSKAGKEYIKNIVANGEKYIKGNKSDFKNDDKVVNEIESTIGIEKAEKIVLLDANKSNKEVVFTEREYDYDDDRAIYEFEFKVDGVKYEYDVDAVTGIIIKKNIDNQGFKANNYNNKNIISMQKAEEIALKDAQVNKDRVVFDDKELDKDDKKAVYEFEFKADGVEYDYKIDAVTGNIIKKEIDMKNILKEHQKKSKYLTIKEVEEIAIKDIKANRDRIILTDVDFDYDDNKAIYELEFKVDSVEYEYDIDAVTGKILKKKIDDDYSNHKDTNTVNNNIMTMQKAEDIVLKDAKVNRSRVVFEDRELDSDDNRMVYEFEFKADGVEYEYKIDAVTGVIIEKDIDRD